MHGQNLDALLFVFDLLDIGIESAVDGSQAQTVQVGGDSANIQVLEVGRFL